MPDRMCLRESPRPFGPGVIAPLTFVATTTSSREMYFGSRRPGGDLARAAGVDVGRVEERDAALDRAPDDRLGGGFVEHPRTVGVVAVAHHPEAHAGDVQPGPAEADLVHQKSSLQEKSGA